MGGQRLPDAPRRPQRARRARAHPAAQEALCRPPSPQRAAQPRDGDHRPAHRPAQSPLHVEPSRQSDGAGGAIGQAARLRHMDIDYFKSVNDNHGHDIGDEVLQEFAKRIGANIRGIDLACRYGGEGVRRRDAQRPTRPSPMPSPSAAQEHRDDAHRDQPRARQAQHNDLHRHRGVGRRGRHRPRRCCAAPTRRSTAQSATAATASSPTRRRALHIVIPGERREAARGKGTQVQKH